MRARRASLPVLLLAALFRAETVEAARTGDVHFSILGGPIFTLADATASSPPIAYPTFGIGSSLAAFPVGEEPKGAIPQFHASVSVSTSERVTVSFDARRFEVEDPNSSLRRSVLAIGPGIRRTVGHGSARPFLQASILLLTEEFHGSRLVSTDAGFGLGLLVGMDVPLGDVVSVPMAASALFGQAENDVSNVGLAVGLAFHANVGHEDPATVEPIGVQAESAPRRPTEADHDPRNRVSVSIGMGGYQFGK